jgi:hypothetical protein
MPSGTAPDGGDPVFCLNETELVLIVGLAAIKKKILVTR